MRHRDLRLELMDAYRHRGRLLAEVRHLVTLSARERDCVALHNHWDAFLKAERWNHARQQTCPTSPASALQLILRWQAAGSPKVFGIHVKGALWFVHRQVKMVSFYSLLWLINLPEAVSL